MDDHLPRTRDLGDLDRLDLDSLVGLTVVQAWKLVRASGGRLRRLDDDPGVAMTFDRSPGRVTVVVGDNHVLRVVGRG